MNKISDILFKKLKKAKWKKEDDCNCSTEYVITIDENGVISAVKMRYSQEEIQKYYEEDEYNFCINNVYNALKSLTFDIIKDKGKPIVEDIYVEIWIKDNGRLENWTR